MGGPLVDKGRMTGATGENCGVEKVGSASPARPEVDGASPNVIAAMERMSMSPEPSVFEVAEGDRMLLDCAGMARASRFASENNTEFSLRCPVSWVVPAPLPPDDRAAKGSIGCAEPPPKRNDEAAAGAVATGADDAGADAAERAEANKSAVPAGVTTVGAANGSASAEAVAAATGSLAALS